MECVRRWASRQAVSETAIDILTFSRDGSHLAYAARIGEKRIVVLDNTSSLPYDDFWGAGPVFWDRVAL